LDEIEDENAPQFDDGDIQKIVDGLIASDEATCQLAVHLLDEISALAIPPKVINKGLGNVLKRGLDSEEQSERYLAERAARLITKNVANGEELDPWFEDLGEQMLVKSTPHLRTGGAALLSTAVMTSEYEFTEEQVGSLLQHVVMTDLVSENFDKQIDSINSVFLIFSEIADQHGEDIVQKLAPVALDRYLHGPREHTRVLVARMLQNLAPNHSDYVAEFILDLTIRLRDSNDQVVLHAGKGLAMLAETRTVDDLRPVCRTVEQALTHDEIHAVFGGLQVTLAIIEEEPAWVEQLPIKTVRDLQDGNRLADEPPARELSKYILDRYAEITDTGDI